MTALEKVKQKLQELNKQNEKTATTNNREWEWKPSPGDNLIRILPYKHGESGYPFIELFIYYNQFEKKGLLSPASPLFSLPDPVVEYLNEMHPLHGVQKDVWVLNKNIHKKFSPTQRVFVPILVRGKEHEGVKFWGFTNKVFTQLLEFFADDDWGDISDLKTGKDIVVSYTPKDENDANSFPKNEVRPKPKSVPATDDNVILEKIANMIKLEEQFTLPTYDELSGYLQNAMKSDKAPAEKVKSESKPTESIIHQGWDVPERKPAESDVDKLVDDLDFDALFNGK